MLDGWRTQALQSHAGTTRHNPPQPPQPPPSPQAPQAPTPGLGGLQHHPDELWHVEVSGVVQGPHVGPARAEVWLAAQGQQMAGEAGGRVCVAWRRIRTCVSDGEGRVGQGGVG